MNNYLPVALARVVATVTCVAGGAGGTGAGPAGTVLSCW